MSREIWKYQLNPLNPNIEAPQGGVVLSCGQQNDVVCVWVLVNPEKPKFRRNFILLGTGRQVPVNLGRFIGTTHIYNGMVVVHVFEEDHV